MSAGHTPGPWQVTIARFEGVTTFRPSTHCETSIAIDPRDYWDEGHQPPTDEYGYFQPDDYMDCDEFRIANGRLIAAAPELLAALIEFVGSAAIEAHHPKKIASARAAIAKATGETP